MNDFTKEELELILNCIWCTISEYNDDKERSKEKFAGKIQSMIDNYCDHPEPYRMCYGATLLDYCDKCKHIFKFIEG